MKRIVVTVALIVFAMSLPVFAKSPSKNETIEQVVQELAEAYAARDLGKLDSEHPYFGKIKIIIEDSLGEGKDAYHVKWVKTLGQAEAWLKSREIDQRPGREIRPLLKCKKGVCTFDFSGGILHNTLYLKRVTYGERKGRPYIKTILLLNGD